MGLLILRGRLRLAALRQLVSERFLAFERFRCVPVVDTLGGRWVRDEQFNIDDQALRVALALARRQSRAGISAGRLSTPLNTGRPLWTFHLIERYRAGQRSDHRIHHCYADGIALLTYALEAGRRRTRSDGRRGGGPHRCGSRIDCAIAARVRRSLREGRPSAASAARPWPRAPRSASPAKLHASAYCWADDPGNPVKRPLTGVKRVAWASRSRWKKSER